METTAKAKYRKATRLLHIILTELNHSEFTLGEIRETFNAPAGARVEVDQGLRIGVIRYGTSELRTLEELGFIAKHEDRDAYYVLHDIDLAADDDDCRWQDYLRREGIVAEGLESDEA